MKKEVPRGGEMVTEIGTILKRTNRATFQFILGEIEDQLFK